MEFDVTIRIEQEEGFSLMDAEKVVKKHLNMDQGKAWKVEAVENDSTGETD